MLRSKGATSWMQHTEPTQKLAPCKLLIQSEATKLWSIWGRTDEYRFAATFLGRGEGGTVMENFFGVEV